MRGKRRACAQQVLFNTFCSLITICAFNTSCAGRHKMCDNLVYIYDVVSFSYFSLSGRARRRVDMNAKVVRDILNDSLGENQFLSFIPSSHYVFSEQEITIKQLRDILNGFENYFTDYIQSENADEITTQQLQNGIKKLRNLEFQHSYLQEKSKTLLVCNSDIFKKEDKIVSKWDPSCLVSLNVSFTKALEIAPDIKEDDPSCSNFNLIHNWKGMKSSSAPIVIPIDVKEMENFLLGSLIMFSIYDSSRCKFPIVLEGPKSCEEMLSTVRNWTEMGEIILSSFDISSEKIGNILKSHLQNIVNSQIVSHTGGGVKLPKRKNVEENLVNVWEERKKSYLSNVSKKNKK